MGRMIDEARNRGANAVVAMRFDTSEMGDTWTEICAYGTAVVAVPVTDAARETATRPGYGQAPQQRAQQPVQPPPDYAQQPDYAPQPSQSWRRSPSVVGGRSTRSTLRPLGWQG